MSEANFFDEKVIKHEIDFISDDLIFVIQVDAKSSFISFARLLPSAKKEKL